MRIFTSLTTLAITVGASVLRRNDAGLDVKLSAEGNTLVKAIFTNNGPVAVELLNKGTFLDSAHVEKVTVKSAAGAVPFLGIRKRIKTAGLAKDAFTTLEAGKSIEIKVDMATVHDLSVGGIFKVTTYGAIPYADAGSTTLIPGRALAYSSNELEVSVDGAAAAKVAHAFDHKVKRTELQSSTCTSSQISNLKSALSDCQQLASAAAGAAASGSASKFEEYFKTTSSSTRGVVAARLRAVATECGSTTNGKTTYYCQDLYSACDSNTLAYTLPSENLVVSCPIYFSYLPVLSNECHAQDMATTTLHEFTHAPAVYSPGTEDNGYGYSAATQLTSAQAVLNADSYALFANAIYVNC